MQGVEALYNSITYGVGGALGGLGGGFIIQTYSASSAFYYRLYSVCLVYYCAFGIKSNKFNAKLFS